MAATKERRFPIVMDNSSSTAKDRTTLPHGTQKGTGERDVRIVRLLLAFVAAVAVTAVVAVAIQSQFVMAGLRDLGAEIGGGMALDMTLHDVAGMAPLYGLFIAAALLIGFLLTGWLWPKVRLARPLSFAIGGGAAVALMLTIMTAVLGISVVAGARTPAGFAAQCAAGVIGGLVFALLSRPRADSHRADSHRAGSATA